MPAQKLINADPTNPDQIAFLFRVAEALVLDGWGATVVANPNEAKLVTNAPSNILEPYVTRYAHNLSV